MSSALTQSSELVRHWRIDPTVAFLNHGSFGACPIHVLDIQRRWRDRLERQPVRFLGREIEPLLDEARAVVAELVGAEAQDLVFVPNATTAVNAVLRSLVLNPGDELLITDHGYGACNNVARYVADRAGAKVVVAKVPFPLRSPDEVVDAVLAAVTPRTRLALLDHVTSPTGLVFPVERLVPKLEGQGVKVLIDGAHAPGMLPLDLRKLNASYYTGNGHKWLCGPKGVGFLVVRRDRQPSVRPHVISHGATSPRTDRSRYLVEFDWVGSSDPSAILSLPDAIHYLASLVPGGWPAVMERNRALALQARAVLSEALHVAPPAPESMIGTLVAMPLPDAHGEPPKQPLFLDPLQDALLDRHRIEVPIVSFPAWPRRLVRTSSQLYNSVDQYRHLAVSLKEELARHP